MRPEDDPGWASYADTILEVHGTPPFLVDLRQLPAPDLVDRLARAGLDGEFGLVTPCNPRGRAIDEAENESRLRDFLAELTARGIKYVRVDGWDRSMERAERGVGLRLPRGEVIALARRWDQSAIYWFDGSRFWVCGALTQAPPWLLPEVAG